MFNALLMLLLTLATASADVNFGDYQPECTQDGPLGMISREIRDWQITASSTFMYLPELTQGSCDAKHSRLYGPDGYSWCAGKRGKSDWLMVDLGVNATVTGVITQGRGDGKEWVTAYRLAYGFDRNNLSYVSDQYGNDRIFDGNVDSYSAKHNYLDAPVATRFVRLHPVKSVAHPSLRMELIGCQPCKQLLSAPPYERIRASSSRGKRTRRACDPSYGHVVTDKGWCAKKTDRNQWLEMDLGPPVLITGVVTKGRGDGRRDLWVTTYRVAYSNDGNEWKFYKDAAHLSPKIFLGNHDRNTEQVHYLNKPFVARYIRFHPYTWKNRIAMRAGVFGCPHRGNCGQGFFRVNNSTRCQANLAFNKNAWVKGGGGSGASQRLGRVRTHGKRDLQVHWHQGAARKAVDGLVARQSCAVLSNAEGVAVPTWFVDLKARQGVQGVLIYTGLNGTSINTALDMQMRNLDRLEVFVVKRPKNMMGKRRREKFLCGIVTNLNKALQQPRVHVSCMKPMEGRYVYLEAWGTPMNQLPMVRQLPPALFSASLCEVVVY